MICNTLSHVIFQTLYLDIRISSADGGSGETPIKLLIHVQIEGDSQGLWYYLILQSGPFSWYITL